MAHWGIAYAVGPNYNKAWDAFERGGAGASVVARAHAAARGRAACAGRATAGRAGADRGAARPATRRRRPAEDCTPWNDAYAAAMRAVYGRVRRRPRRRGAVRRGADQPHAVAAVGPARPASRPRRADTLEAVAVLERALARRPAARRIPALLHMYIHLMEMSPYPERALRAADALRDAGARRRPPACTCRPTSTCCAATTATSSPGTSDAIVADRKFLAREGRAQLLHALPLPRLPLQDLRRDVPRASSRPALRGRRRAARDHPRGAAAGRDAADGRLARGLRADADARAGPLRPLGGDPRRAAARRPGAVLRDHGDAALRQGRRATRRTGDLGGGRREQRELFDAARPRVPDSRDGVQQHRAWTSSRSRRRCSTASSSTAGATSTPPSRTCAGRSSSTTRLPYDEPWGWMQPARHALGALLLEQGRVDEAEAVYRADLGLDGTLPPACQHPDNVWSLHGYHECLVAAGQGGGGGGASGRSSTRPLARATVPIRAPASAACRPRVSAARGSPRRRSRARSRRSRRG